jgi:hypothetical protein
MRHSAREGGISALREQGSYSFLACPLMVQEGGGWCISEEDCLARSATALGSSSQWPPSGCPSMDGGSNGMLSDSQAINPYFYNWNGVHVNVSLYSASQWAANQRSQAVRRMPRP